MRVARFVETFGKDVRYAVRQCRRSPGLAVVVVLSLALGIGANTALFTVVNAVMLRGAGVFDPASLVAFGWLEQKKAIPDQIMDSQSGRNTEDAAGRPIGLSFPYPSCTYIRAHARTLSYVAGFAPLGMFNRASAVVRDEAMFVDGDMVTGDYFAALGVAPALGRVISHEDENPAAPRVGVISDGFWTRVFARDPSVLGTTITLSRVPVTIVGVAPRGFEGLETGRSPDIWIPITLQATLAPWGIARSRMAEATFVRPDYWWMQIFGRLEPGATREQAQAEVSRLLRASFAGAAPEASLNSVPRVESVPAASAYNIVRSRFSKPLLILGGVVGVVLLVACANVATLLLARATSRRKEMSVRLAMGASRGRLFRQLLTEHGLYACAGAAVGLIFAAWGGRLLLMLLSAGMDRLPIDVRVDLRALGFTAGVSMLTTLLFGVVPAVRATRVAVAADLKDTGGGSARELRFGRFRLGRLFVAAQIALTLPLVVGAGLFLRTLANLEGEPLGFKSENLLLFSLDATKAGYKDDGLLAAYEEMRQAIEAVPGVKAATFSNLALVSGWNNNGRIVVEGQPADARAPLASWNAVGPAFFRTMGMRLVLGRALDGRDVQGSLEVAVINETMARRFFGESSPIGRRFWQARGGPADAIMVVGVLADAKYSSVRAPVPATYFVPSAQARTAALFGMFFEVRTAGDPLSVVDRMREIARRVAPGVPIDKVKTQAAQIAQSLSQERMFASLFTFFGLTALALACLGLQGTMAYTLRRRTREIGIRMALGAARASVLRMALGETLVIAIAGITVGGGLATGGARFVRSLMFGVTPLNPVTIACGTALMLAVTVVAGYIPARRASRIDPMQALREE